MEDVARELERSLKVFAVILVVVSFTVGAVLMWAIPVVWEWLRPWLHEVTK